MYATKSYIYFISSDRNYFGGLSDFDYFIYRFPRYISNVFNFF